MSHRKETLKKGKKVHHKICNSLHKYKINRIQQNLVDWPSTELQMRSQAYEISKIPKVVRAFIEVSQASQQSNRKSLGNSYCKTQNLHGEVRKNSEINESESYCKCNQPYVQGELMFKCEGFCGNWYHPDCLKMKNEEIEKQKNTNVRWYCPKCIKKAMEVMAECYEFLPVKKKTTTIG